MNDGATNRTIPQKCPQCGALLPAGTLAGLCPACLLQQGAAADTATRPEAKPFVPPTVEEVARLFPQLEILGLLGKGGMGTVYKARQPALDRLVALKVLPTQAAPDPGFAERFSREARALARLSHPNIVAVYEFGQVRASGAGVPPTSAAGVPPALPSIPSQATGGTPALPYFVMEFVDGVNLRQLQKAGRLSPREALQIVPQICDALQFAHDEGIVHRDIKPENILVDRKGRVKIADFGLAKILGHDPEALRLTGEGQVMGTLHYMAPEQVEHPLAVDHRADIYSLGVVFYEMLTGELPLGKFQPPSCKVQVDVRLDEVVLHALEKEPDRRYQHVSEVKTAVETISSTTPSGPMVGTRPTVPGEAPGEKIGASRLSRTALAGVIWAPFALLAFLAFIGVQYAVPAGEYHGPAWWRIPLLASLLPLGITAPFGTTLLGWLAIAQIRRSNGLRYGLGLAFFDGVLFPLLTLAWLLARFWWWFYSDPLMRAIARPVGQPRVINEFHAFVLHHIGAITVLVAVAISTAAGFFLVRWAWRRVKMPMSGWGGHSAALAAPPGAPPRTTGVGAWKIAAAAIVAVVALNCVIAVVALRPALFKSPPTSGASTTPSPEKYGAPAVQTVITAQQDTTPGDLGNADSALNRPEPAAGHSQQQRLPEASVSAGTNTGFKGDTQDVARLKLEIAERELKEVAKKQQVGVATTSEFEKARMARDIAAAEIKGDAVEVARLKLQITEVDLRDIQKRVEVGMAAQLDCDKAKLARDVAAAEYLRQQQLHPKQN